MAGKYFEEKQKNRWIIDGIQEKIMLIDVLS